MSSLAALWRTAADTARLMIGLPSYDAYVAHMAAHHPGIRPMSRAQFFRNRQDARYGAGGGPKCC